MRRAIAWMLLLLLIQGCSGTPVPVAQHAQPTAASASTTAPVIAQPNIDGPWHGVLAGKLHLALAIARASNGYTGVLDSIDQGATLPIDRMTFDAGVLRFEIASVGGSFEGKIDATANAIAGTWTQHGIAQPLSFAKGPSEAKREIPPPLDAPIDVAVIAPPAALRADDHTHYVYELNVTNFSHHDVSLRRIEVSAHNAEFARLENAELAAACARPATGDVDIGPGLHVVVYLWVTSDAPVNALDHRITVRVAGTT